MAAVTPLYFTTAAGATADLNFNEFSSTDMDNVLHQAVRQWGSSTVWYDIVPGTGNQPLPQTRRYTKRTSGAGENDNDGVDEYPDYAASVGTYTVYYREHNLNTSGTYSNPLNQNQVTNGEERGFPLYYNGNDIKAMTETQFIDTFIKPAIEKFIDDPTGDFDTTHYTVSSSDTLDGYVQQSQIYQDWYSSGTYRGLPIKGTGYYLFKKDVTGDVTYKTPLYATSDGNIKQFSKSDFNALLQNYMKYVASAVTKYRVSYAFAGTSVAMPDFEQRTSLGTAILDYYRSTVSSTYRKKTLGGPGVSDDRYYSYRYPSGTLKARRTINLYLYRY